MTPTSPGAQHVPRGGGDYADRREDVEVAEDEGEEAQVVAHEEDPEEGGSLEDLRHAEGVAQGRQARCRLGAG